MHLVRRLPQHSKAVYYHSKHYESMSIGCAEVLTQSQAYQARCRPSGKATTQETTPELIGLRKVFKIFGVPEAARPVCRTSHTSIVPFRLPAYI